MQKLSLFEKIGILLSIIKTSPLFIISFIVGIVLITMMFLDLKTTNKIKEKLFIIVWISVMVFIGYRYYSYLIKLSDNLVEEIFMAIYFPNLAIYTIIIISINIVLISALLKNKLTMSYKVANIFTTVVLDFLFVLILEIIVTKKIDIYESLTVYSNKELLTLIELSSGMYTAWLFVIGIIRIVDKTLPIPEETTVEVPVKEKIEIPIIESVPVYNSPVSNAFLNESYSKPTLASVDTVDYTDIFFQNPSEKHSVPNIAKEEPIKTIVKEEPKIIPVIESKVEPKIVATTEPITIEPKVEPIKAIVEEEPKNITVIESKMKPIKTIVKEEPKIIPVIESKVEPKIVATTEPITIEPKVEPIKTIKEVKEVLFHSLFKKKEQTIETTNENYRIPLFDSLNEDALLNCIVPLQKESNEPIIQNIPVEEKPSISAINNITIKLDGKTLLDKFNRGEQLDIEEYKILKDYIMTKQGI